MMHKQKKSQKNPQNKKKKNTKMNTKHQKKKNCFFVSRFNLNQFLLEKVLSKDQTTKSKKKKKSDSWKQNIFAFTKY